MLRIDNNLLQEVGLGGLPDSEKNSLLRHIYETLEMRVGIRLADQMSNEQLDEFERYFEAKDDAGAFKWLETNFPNYKEIVQEEFDKLKAEVAQSAPQILSSSAQQAQVPTPQTAAAPVADPYSPQPAPAAPQAPQPQPTVVPSSPASPAPAAPMAPPVAVPGDINMPTQPPQTNVYSVPQAPAENSGYPYPSAPNMPQQFPQSPSSPAAGQQPMPPFPDQQPPAGPGDFQQ